jgi:hypothetical protein
MVKKAKKRSAVSRVVRTVEKAASSAARSTRRAAKKMMPGTNRARRNPLDVRLLHQLTTKAEGQLA